MSAGEMHETHEAREAAFTRIRQLASEFGIELARDAAAGLYTVAMKSGQNAGLTVNCRHYEEVIEELRCALPESVHSRLPAAPGGW